MFNRDQHVLYNCYHTILCATINYAAERKKKCSAIRLIGFQEPWIESSHFTHQTVPRRAGTVASGSPCELTRKCIPEETSHKSLVNPQRREITLELEAQCPKVQISDAQNVSAALNGETIASIGQSEFILCQTCAKNAYLHFFKECFRFISLRSTAAEQKIPLPTRKLKTNLCVTSERRETRSSRDISSSSVNTWASFPLF